MCAYRLLYVQPNRASLNYKNSLFFEVLIVARCLSDPVRRDAHEHVQPGEAVRPELRPRAQRQQDPQVVLTILRPAGAAAVETLLDSAVRAKSGDII